MWVAFYADDVAARIVKLRDTDAEYNELLADPEVRRYDEWERLSTGPFYWKGDRTKLEQFRARQAELYEMMLAENEETTEENGGDV